MFRESASTNQPCVTGQELTGNQCIQPPILHQYSVSHSHQKPAPLIVSAFCSFALFFSSCISAMCLFESHLYFKEIFVSLLSNDQAHRQEDGALKRWERREERWRVSLWSPVSPNQIFMRRWQLEECAVNSPNVGHVAFGFGYCPGLNEQTGWSGEKKKCPSPICLVYTVYAQYLGQRLLACPGTRRRGLP